MIKFIRELQRKPRHVKNNFAFAFASVFTGVVAMVWFYGVVNQNTTLSSETIMNEQTAPFSNLFKQSKEQLANISNSLKLEKGTEVSEDSPEIESNPMNITLSQEEIEKAKQNQPNEGQVYIASSTINNENSLFKDPKPTYREIQIATTSSQKKEQTGFDAPATTSDSLF